MKNKFLAAFIFWVILFYSIACIHVFADPQRTIFGRNAVKEIKSSQVDLFKAETTIDRENASLAEYKFPCTDKDQSSVSFPESGEFVDVSAGIEPLYNSYAAWGDYDADGDLDLVTTGRAWAPPTYPIRIHLYKNNGNGTFQSIAVTNLEPVERGKLEWVDFDKDGYVDLMIYGAISVSQVATKIYRNNNGTGTFSDIGASLPGMAQGDFSWADYDNDGYPDFVMTGMSGGGGTITQLYHNNGNGGFTQVNCSLPSLNSSSISWVDFNNDGRLDIFIEGYSASTSWTSKLYRNEGVVNGQPQFILMDTNLPAFFYGRNVWGDYDNDGDLDFVFSGGPISEVNNVFRNDGPGAQANSWIFTNTYALSLPVAIGAENTAWSAAWGDYDNDTDLDILITGLDDSSNKHSRVYRNDGADVFTDIDAGLQPIAWGNAVWGDYDNDGDLDIAMVGTKTSTGCGVNIAVAKLYRNVLSSNIPSFNTLPTPPSAPSLNAVVIGNDVTLHWGDGFDYQTPDAGLYYNVVVGTTSNPSSVISPMAEVPDGYRHLPALGTQGQNKSWTIKDLSDGTYSWGVQTIDTAFAGSPFVMGTFTIGAPSTITISGVVNGPQGPVSDFFINVTNANPSLPVVASTVTQADGSYVLDVPYGWSGIVQAAKPGYVVVDPQGGVYSYANVTSQQENRDYKAILEQYTISGIVKYADGSGFVAGAELKDDGNNILAITDPNGFYSFQKEACWSGVVRPYKDGHLFDPVEREYTDLQSSQVDQDYIAKKASVTISGTIVSSPNDMVVSGVVLKDENGNILATTDSNGSYAFEKPIGWSGIVTPSKPKYVFMPQKRKYENVQANLSQEHYMARSVGGISHR